jgi:hypothetical protein
VLSPADGAGEGALPAADSLTTMNHGFISPTPPHTGDLWMPVTRHVTGSCYRMSGFLGQTENTSFHTCPLPQPYTW